MEKLENMGSAPAEPIAMPTDGNIDINQLTGLFASLKDHKQLDGFSKDLEKRLNSLEAAFGGHKKDFDFHKADQDKLHKAIDMKLDHLTGQLETMGQADAVPSTGTLDAKQVQMMISKVQADVNTRAKLADLDEIQRRLNEINQTDQRQDNDIALLQQDLQQGLHKVAQEARLDLDKFSKEIQNLKDYDEMLLKMIQNIKIPDQPKMQQQPSGYDDRMINELIGRLSNLEN